MTARGRSRANVRYTFDALNRLVVAGQDGLAPTRVLEGTVTADRRNRLLYRVDSTNAADGFSGPHRFNLDGTLGLTRSHDLKLTLHEAGRRRRRSLFLKGARVQARAHALTVALRRHALDGRQTTQRLTLTGRWQADRHNRLVFLVAELIEPGVYVLDLRW